MHSRGFVIVKDGGCTYEEKARLAEKLGAQGLIIAHDSRDHDIPSRVDNESESQLDGSGLTITIPTIIIDSVSSQKLLDLVEENSNNFDKKIVLRADIEISDRDS